VRKVHSKRRRRAPRAALTLSLPKCMPMHLWAPDPNWAQARRWTVLMAGCAEAFGVETVGIGPEFREELTATRMKMGERETRRMLSLITRSRFEPVPDSPARDSARARAAGVVPVRYPPSRARDARVRVTRRRTDT
jgi:hypothetical protein